MNQLQITKDSIPNVLQELETAYADIPFGNSEFQTKNFVIAAKKTPGRAYRTIGLQLFSTIQNVKKNIVQIELDAIDIEENEHKMSLPETSEFDKRRLKIKNIELNENRKWVEKLLSDALIELNYLYQEFKKFPAYTREKFELEEELHFKIDLEQQIATCGGAHDSLLNCTLNAPRLNEMLENPSLVNDLVVEVRKNNAALLAKE